MRLKLSQFAVPKHRIIDAAPIALILLLLSIPNIVSPIFPVALLQVWLWLRHPRSGSRYWIAFGIVLLFFAVAAGVPLLKFLTEYYTSGASSRMNLVKYLALLAVAVTSASGVLPIVYRFLSRISLCFVAREPSPQERAGESRGGIIDILFLSLFCAGIFVSLRATRAEWNIGSTMSVTRVVMLALMLSACVSAGAIFSMRLLARSRGAGLILNFLVAWFVSSLAVVLTGVTVAYVYWQFWRDVDVGSDLSWFVSILDEFFRTHELSSIAFFCVLLPAFALVMRRCGVILARPQVPQKTDAQPAGWRARAHKTLGIATVATFAAVVCLAPVPLLRQGVAVAGWPMKYWDAALSDPLPGNMIPHRETLEFSGLALMVNVACATLFTLAVFPPPALTRRAGPRKLWLARTVVIGGMVALMVHTCVIRPRQIFARQSEFATERSSRWVYYGSPVPALLHALEPHLQWLPETDRRRIVYLDASDLSREQVERALAMPRLRGVSLERSDVSLSALESLRGSPFLQVLDLGDYEPEDSIAALVASLGNLEWLEISSRILPFEELPKLSVLTKLQDFYYTIMSDGMGDTLEIPPSVKYVKLRIYDGGVGTLNVTGAEGMETMRVDGALEDDVRKFRFGRVSKLRILEFSREQAVDLEIEDAPLLTTLTDSIRSRDVRQTVIDPFELHRHVPRARFAQLARFSIGRAPYLKKLHLDVSAYRSGSKPSAPPIANRPVIDEVQLCGRLHLSEPDYGRLPSDTAAQVVSDLATRFDVAELTLYGIDVDRAVGRVITQAFSLKRLTLFDCTVTADAFDDAAGQGEWTILDAPTYAPGHDQFVALVKKLPKLSDLRMDGTNLRRLPRNFAPTGIVQLKNAGQLDFQGSSLVARAAHIVTMGDEQLRELKFGVPVEAEASVFLHGESADDQAVAQLKKRLGPNPIQPPHEAIALLSPTATKDSFRNIDWGMTRRVSIIDAVVDDATVETWNLSNVEFLDLSGSDVSIRVLSLLQEIPNQVSVLWLNDLPDVDSAIPDLKRRGLRLLGLNGRKINAADMDRLIESKIFLIDLTGCQLTPEAAERMQSHEAGTAEAPKFMIRE